MIQDYLNNNVLFMEFEEQFSPRNYLKNHNINGEHRMLMMDWLIDCNQKLKFDVSTLFLSLNIMDRYFEIEQLFNFIAEDYN